LIIAGIDQKGESIYVTDPSGTYVQYAAVAIGAGSEDVNDFLEKHYNPDMSIDDASSLAIAAINLKDKQKDGVDDIKMAKITTETKVFEKVSESDLKNYSQNASKFGTE
jgi:proteasome alpha subunit